MTAPSQRIVYRAVADGEVESPVTVVGQVTPAPAGMLVRDLLLADGTPVRQLLAHPHDRLTGYQRIDNEILAGLRMADAARSQSYPQQLSRLVGYAADGREPFVLLEGYRGQPIAEVAGHLLPDGQYRFQVGLLTGLRWLIEAGIAHRGLSPAAVRWDGQDVQITDFSLSTVFGATREVTGALPWAAPEQRAGQVTGRVGSSDDVWSAGRLIFYVISGEDLIDRAQLKDWPAIEELVAGVFEPPEQRPSATEMLVGQLRARDPVPVGLGMDQVLDRYRAEFYELRALKHPQVVPGEPAAEAPDAPQENMAEPAPPPRVSPNGGGAHARRRRLGLLAWQSRDD